MTRCYPAVVVPAGDGFSVNFPDLPGLTSGGATLQEAARNAEEALQAHLDLAEEHGDPLPEPSAAPVDQDIQVAAQLLVRVRALGDLREALAQLAGDPKASRGAFWTRLSLRKELAHRLQGPAP
jgi:predicted RNase H-like HicB family nuclease